MGPRARPRATLNATARTCVPRWAMASDSASAATSRPPHVGRLLGAYVLQSMDPEEADAVREHLAGCALCSTEYAALLRTVRLLRRYERPGPGPP
jgi:hypothetical protein